MAKVLNKKFKYELVMKTALSELEFNKKTELYPNMRFEVHEDLNFTYTEDILKVLKANKHKVCSLHLPQKTKDVMYGVKDLFLYREGLDILHATFDAAEMCYTTSKVAIVIHMDMLFKDVVRAYGISTFIVNTLQAELASHPHVQVVFENTIPVYPNAGTVTAGDGYLYDNVELVDWLSKQMVSGSSQLGTCLDITHALMTCRSIDNVVGNHKCYRPTLDSFIERNAAYCKLVHLNNCNVMGYGEDHGIEFSTEQLTELLSKFDNYGYTAPLVVEMQEDDYTDPVRLQYTIEQFKTANRLLSYKL